MEFCIRMETWYRVIFLFYFRTKPSTNQILLMFTANSWWPWLVGLALQRQEPLVVDAGCCHPCFVGSHPHLHGPADHCRYRQQKGEQAEGKTQAPSLKIVLYCIVLYCIVLYCIVLCCVVLYCIVLYCIESWLCVVNIKM